MRFFTTRRGATELNRCRDTALFLSKQALTEVGDLKELGKIGSVRCDEMRTKIRKISAELIDKEIPPHEVKAAKASMENVIKVTCTLIIVGLVGLLCGTLYGAAAMVAGGLVAGIRLGKWLINLDRTSKMNAEILERVKELRKMKNEMDELRINGITAKSS